MRPTLLRPPRCRLLSTSAECGPPLCRPGVTTLTKARRPGDVGLALMSGISLVSLYPEPALGLLSGQVDLAARRQAHIGLLPVAAPAERGAEALLLAAHV